jgi:hypothetical protein
MDSRTFRTLHSLGISLTFVCLSACASHDLETLTPRDGGLADASGKDLAADLSSPTTAVDAGGGDGERDVPQTTPDVAATESGRGEATPVQPVDAGVSEAGQAIDGAAGADGAEPETSPAVDAGVSEALPTLPAEFSGSPCKKEVATARAGGGVSLAVIDNPTGLEGLKCVAWERGSSAQVALDLFNFEGACGAEWSGNGALAGSGTLELSVVNPECKIARCGICMYDWSFVVHAAVPANQTVPVVITIDACPTSAGTQLATTTAAIGPESTGIRCSFADYGALAWHASAKSLCGKAGMPCVGSSMCGSGGPTSTGTCDTGLVCDSSAAANEPRCLVPCASVADCPRADVWSCTAGLCRPRD